MTRAEWEEVLAEQDRLEAEARAGRPGWAARGPVCDLRPGGVNVPSFNGLIKLDGPLDDTTVWFVSWPRAPRPWWAELRDKACAALNAWREG